MKNKIKQFAKGDFKLQRPDIVFPETHILISVGEGEVYQGSFLIENRKDGDIRGLVYPSSFRVHCLEQGFEGNPVNVRFTFDSTGLLPGQMEHGKFTVVCNGGEYDLDFTAMIEKPFIMTAYGKVQTISDFRKLAMQDFAEARRLFRTRQFYDILKYEEPRVRNLYANMRKWSLDEQALEEFLVGIKQKEKIFLTLSEEHLQYQDVLEDKKDAIEITKNTWGHASIDIRVQGDFISMKQTEITTEDFVGNNYRLEYFIQKDKLHGGNNFGRIYVDTPYESLCVEVDVHQRTVGDDSYGMKGMIAGQGLKEYLSYISGKTDVHTWVEKAIERAKQLKELEPDNEHYQLLQAHIYLRGGRDEEARWILENGNFHKFVIGRKAEISAYYLFLMALLKKDTPSTVRALEEIHRLYMKHPYSWPLLCMLVNLDPKYRDYGDRLRVLERQFFNGSNQVLLYAEAYICFQERVLLLRKLESFEIQILNFATKYRIISKELALYAADLISQQKKYSKQLVSILQRAYEMYEDNRILNALCMQLIKGNKIGTEYYKWYEKAVRQELRIAQLYEYYMMSMDPQRVRGAFPKIVYLYFTHGINLDYRRTALLYENILTYEDENSEIYRQYKEQIRQFAKEQLLKRHINESLRIIYNRFIQEKDVSSEEFNALYDICHKYHVTTKQKDIKYVLVIEKDGEVRQRVAYTEYGANVYLYDKESRIVWEASNGVYYTDSISYDVVRLFYEMRFMELCKNRRESMVEAEQESQRVPLSFDNMKLYGLNAFDEEAVFLMCTKRIREQENVEDDFLLYVSFQLLKRGMYDKALLNYLSHFYCGATGDMKFLWRQAREYGVATKELAERIITQMLFSEVMFHEEDIFEDYYVGRPYFRLKQAYLAYVAYGYVVENREVNQNVFAIIMKELRAGEYLADICKAAILKFFSRKEVDETTAEILKGYLHDLCEKRIVFAFYQDYPKQWLREVLLYDKYIVEYHAGEDAKVKVVYQVEDGETHTENLLPTYENTYIKEFTLYHGETLYYYFKEEEGGKQIVSEKYSYTQEPLTSFEGKYGRLNQMIELPEEEKLEAMLQFRREENLAIELFPTY